MPTTPTVLAVLAVQALAALLTAALFGSFYRYYQRRYLLQWARSFYALSGYLAASSLGLYLAPMYPPSHPLRIVATVLSLVAAYLQVGWLLFGTFELAAGRPIASRIEMRIGALLAVLAVLAALAFTDEPDAVEGRLILRVTLRALLTGLAFCVAAYGVWRASRQESGIGHKLVALSFLAYGVEQLQIAGVSLFASRFGWSFPVAHLIGYVELLLQFAIALGLVIWLLEDERRATVEAGKQVEHLAYHDTLTGLPNRQLFLDRLHQAVAQAGRHGHRLAVCFLDLDRFKVVNDSLGHAAGDDLLRAVARRVNDVLRSEDTLARIGGDEFTVLAPNMNRPDDAAAVARKLRDAIRRPLIIEGHELFVTPSIGVAVFPEDGTDAHTLLKNADTAMYRAKERGRDTVELYAPAMNARAAERLALEVDLRRALTAGELEVHYQPVTTTATGQVIGVEALARWRHPRHGLLRSGEFLPIAESAGLAGAVGEAILRITCEQIRRWRDSGHPTLRALVNVSARQMQDSNFIPLVAAILASTGLPPEALELEVTESVALQGEDGTLERLRELKRFGVRLSIDDFGTGSSSLAALRFFPADALKIDRSFIANLGLAEGDRQIVAAVIAMAHRLNLAVVAEGVETEEQLEFLRDHRCDLWQGYLCSEPVDAAQMTGRLAEWTVTACV